MNKTKRHILSFIMLVALLTIPTLVVFAKELGLLTISGPGIKGELTLSDPKDMMNLERSGFFEQIMLTKEPTNLNLETGYTLTAHLNLDGRVVPFAQMVYYATSQDQPSYIHYTGRLNGETLQTVNEWYVLSRADDGTLRSMMVANNITVQSALIKAPAAVAPAAPAAAEPVAAPAVSPMTVQPPYVILALIAAILILAGAGLAVRRRTVSHPST